MPDFRIERPADDDFDIDEIVSEASTAWADAQTPEQEQEVLAAMTPGQRLLMAYTIYFDQCTSGDQSTFLWNSTGNLWEYALEATRVMGLPDYEILREAIALFQDGRPSKVTAERRDWLRQLDAAGKLDEWDQKFEALDARYYDLPDRSELINKYIRAHADDFFRPGAG